MDTLLTTPLHALHQELGAKLVPFAGYEMPVHYPLGILKEHLHTRAQAGLFDVSHMGQIRVSGDAAAQALEALMPVDLLGLAPFQQRYALLTNETGGIIDDLMVGHWGDHYLLVVNAACKHGDAAHLRARLPAHIAVEPLPQRALLALQGPAARGVMQRLAPALGTLPFMALAQAELAGARCWVSCSGYTGEDGFEIAMQVSDAEAVARLLLAQPEVEAIGLGARDSLRLEAGLCLYGHDIDAGTNPICAGLGWAISKARRPEGARAGGYPGAQSVEKCMKQGCDRRRVMLHPEGRAPVREGCEIVDGQGRVVGHVSSGGYGPTLASPIAMGYVESAVLDTREPVFALLRGKPQPLAVLPNAPFSPRYFRG